MEQRVPASGWTRCRACGGVNDRLARRCYVCGSLDPAPRCPTCGAAYLNPLDASCPECNHPYGHPRGAKLDGSGERTGIFGD